MRRDRPHERVEQDEGILYAAIQAIGSEQMSYNTEFMRKVPDSYAGESAVDLANVAVDYIEEHWPGFPVNTIGDLEAFATAYAIPESQVAGEIEAGGTLHHFDRNQW
ncbi:hypothetical protein [Streptomyces noursei]|uniref:hypothetical protein n=1 Tax=Streptomyces noursei TaxID=1971 RepID=UPI0011AEC49E|nr:hypothetical protein [Streptomyces noursei]